MWKGEAKNESGKLWLKLKWKCKIRSIENLLMDR